MILHLNDKIEAAAKTAIEALARERYTRFSVPSRLVYLHYREGSLVDLQPSAPSDINYAPDRDKDRVSNDIPRNITTTTQE